MKCNVPVPALIEKQFITDPFILILAEDLLLGVVPGMVEEDLIEEVAMLRLFALLEVDWGFRVDADACGVRVVKNPVILRIDYVFSLG